MLSTNQLLRYAFLEWSRPAALPVSARGQFSDMDDENVGGIFANLPKALNPKRCQRPARVKLLLTYPLNAIAAGSADNFGARSCQSTEFRLLRISVFDRNLHTPLRHSSPFRIRWAVTSSSDSSGQRIWVAIFTVDAVSDTCNAFVRRSMPDE
jgi:hypothetical protein